MMRFAFIIDCSPLMELKHFSGKRGQPKKAEGMTFFQKAVYAIEEFVRIRSLVTRQFSEDKYFLFRMAGEEELETEKATKKASCVLSSWEHSYKHFHHQLCNLKLNPTLSSPNSLSSTVRLALKVLNCKRFLCSSDNRIHGLCLSRIECAQVIVFTANAQLQQLPAEVLLASGEREPFKERLNWDQRIHIFNFRHKKSENCKKLRQLCKMTGGHYYPILGSMNARFFIQLLAHNSSHQIQIIMELPPSKQQQESKPNCGSSIDKVNCFFDIRTKMKRSLSTTHESKVPGHYSNAESVIQRSLLKDKWPLPLQNLPSTSGHPFGSTYPQVRISSTPSDFKFPAQGQAFCYESVHIQELDFILEFVERHVEPYQYEDVFKLSWEVFCRGETERYPFGLLVLQSNPFGKQKLSPEELEKARVGDVSIMSVAPYALTLLVLPLNFKVFWPLIWSMNAEFKNTKDAYLKTRWKLQFDKYVETLPPYYYDYLNSYLRFLDVPQLMLPNSETLILGNNATLERWVRDMRMTQGQHEKKLERKFEENRREHLTKHSGFACCSNLQKSKESQQQADQHQDHSVSIIESRESLLSEVLHQSEEVFTDLFQDLYLGSGSYEGSQKLSQELGKCSQAYSHSGSSLDQLAREICSECGCDYHELPISVMGSIELAIRRKEFIRSAHLEDDENEALHRPYLGNPYKAPGTIHTRGERQKSQQKEAESKKAQYLELDDERFLDQYLSKGLDDSIYAETVIGNNDSQPSVSTPKLAKSVAILPQSCIQGDPVSKKKEEKKVHKRSSKQEQQKPKKLKREECKEVKDVQEELGESLRKFVSTQDCKWLRKLKELVSSVKKERRKDLYSDLCFYAEGFGLGSVFKEQFSIQRS